MVREDLSEKIVYLDEWYNLHPPQGAYHGFDAPPEILALASPHWLTFPPVHPFVQHGLGIFFFFVWIICSVGNLIVIYIFLKVKTLRTASNILVVALALSDFIMITHQAPPLFISMFISKYWAFGHFPCRLYGLLAGISGCGSLWLVIFIGYDRYNVIVKGFKGKKLTPLKACLMVLFAFCYSTSTVMPAFLEIFGKFNLEGLLNTCAFHYLATEEEGIDQYYVGCLFFFNFCIPFCHIVYFYSQIVKAVVAHERSLREQAKKMNVESLRTNEDANKESAEIKIAKVALTAVLLWLMAWCPYAVVVLTAQYGPTHLITPVVAQLPSMLLKVQACFNPIIYAISHPKFREALAVELPCLGIGDKPEENKSNETKTQQVSGA